METCGLTVLIFYLQKKIDNEGTKSLLVYLLYKQYFGENSSKTFPLFWIEYYEI